MDDSRTPEEPGTDEAPAHRRTASNLARAVDILRWLGRSAGGGLRLQELIERTGLAKATAHRLLGEHEISAFRAAECQSSTAMRRLLEATVERSGETVCITVRANAFLQHMVRNLAGTLLLVGAGQRPEGWIAEVLEARDRTLAGPTAPPQGLYFAGVEYPAEFDLPSRPQPSGRLEDRPAGGPP
jgi:tRNA pseudouridine38-40 synthase